MGKKRVNKYPTAFRKMALERLKSCRNLDHLRANIEEFAGLVMVPIIAKEGVDGVRGKGCQECGCG